MSADRVFATAPDTEAVQCREFRLRRHVPLHSRRLPRRRYRTETQDGVQISYREHVPVRGNKLQLASLQGTQPERPDEVALYLEDDVELVLLLGSRTGVA